MATHTSGPFLDHHRRPSATRIVQTSTVRSQIGGQSHPATSSSPSISRKKPCMCSPTTHPGSFRCSLHRSSQQVAQSPLSSKTSAARMSSTDNGKEIVKRALAAMIRPSSRQVRRREVFQQQPSRLSSVVSV